ncbi:MAG: RICIN domain-containing protein [Gluconacetobacter diazotrophicus]|nr:RICIN domain-containing protein [Gluconacetobacter diazotrophicus]
MPWMFELPVASDSAAMAQLLDAQGFAAPYGPTTAERRSRWFEYQAATCCHWDGPSWPYETSQTLTGVANLLQDYPAQTVITRTDYLALLRGYAATQHRNGVPYVAEAHSPDTADWIYDSPNHSEDYNHSTFNDNVISGLIGLRGQPDDTLVVNPLAPSTWDYFALENAPYHGHNVTVLWDRTGARYRQGVGLRAFVDGRPAGSRRTLGSLAITVGAPLPEQHACRIADVAANSQQVGYGPQPVASYPGYQPGTLDSVWHAIDGVVFREGIPENTRWTTYNSPNATDSYGVDFQRPVTLQGVNLVFYDDGGGVRVPTGFDLQYWTGSDWTSVPNQSRHQASPLANGPNEIDFPALSTSRIRVVAPNRGGGTGWGLSEFQGFGRRVFQVVNGNSGLLVGVKDGSGAAGAPLQQFADTGAADHLWELVPAGQGGYLVRNLDSGLVMGVSGAQTTDGAAVDQEVADGSANQTWVLADENANGRFKLRNRNSGRLLGVDGESRSSGGRIVQFSDNGTPDHLWQMEPAAAPAGQARLASSCEQSLIR